MYEIKANLGANLFFSLDEIVFQLKCNYDFATTHEEVLKVIQDDKVIFLLSFDDIIKKVELLRGVDITKDNIHLYYEFMSDEDLQKNINILENIFMQRSLKVARFFNMYNCDFFPLAVKTSSEIGKTSSLYIFGVKDTLKPIDEYIKEIKESSEYKEYIESKGV